MHAHTATRDVAIAGQRHWRGRTAGTTSRLCWSKLTALVASAVLLLFPGCDDGFNPIAPTELQYSVFGYLDAAADTQWIRVMPIRPLVPTEPDSFGATVTLEQLGSGRLITLRDSLFRYPPTSEVGADTAYLHNFWTTERIEAGASYRLSVRRPGEELAQATVVVPRDFDVEVWLSQDGRDSLRVSGLRYVPFVSGATFMWDICGSGSDRTGFPVRAVDSDVHTIAVRKTSLQNRAGCGQFVLEKRQLWVAGSETEWPSQADATWGLAVPDMPSNVSHATGFVGGVLTKLIPYENCEYTGPSPLPRFCKLRYGGTTATLTGSVREVRCGKGPLDSTLVQLTELNPNPTHRQVRTVLTNRNGDFAIAALEPGIRYVLKARSPTRPNPGSPPIDMYAAPTDTLQFSPGEHRDFVVGFRQLSECWLNPT